MQAKLLLLVFSSLLLAISMQAAKTNEARYDNYRLYNVELSNLVHVKLFQELQKKTDSCIFLNTPSHAQQNLYMLVPPHKFADFTDLLQSYSLQHTIESYDFQKQIDANLRSVPPKSVYAKHFDWQHYFHLETIDKWLDSLAKKHSNRVSLLNLGASTQELPMHGLKLGKNAQNKAIVVLSGLHAREWAATAAATFLINELLFSNEPRVQALLNNYNWLIFPVLNVDGYKYSFEKDRLWHKNRQLFGVCRGVDLNRNFAQQWNHSDNSCAANYAGAAAASEIETQHLMQFISENMQKEQIKGFLSLHAHSQLLMFANAYAEQHVANYDELLAIAQTATRSMQSRHGKVYKSGSVAEVLFPISGSILDWTYAAKGIPISFALELRGGDAFLLPASELSAAAEETFAGIQVIVEEAEARGYFK